MNSGKAPIGIFDSGLGGLTVFSEIRKILPNENIVYFGDTARLPYGTKTPEAVIEFSKEIVSFLAGRGVKYIVVACNTASAVALREIKKFSPVPVSGIVRPSVEAAVSRGAKRIAVIGTEATINSRQYGREIALRGKGLKVVEKACPLFVPLIEEGWVGKKVALMIISEYLRPLKKKRFDTMILGCTHYPLMKRQIEKVLGGKAVIIDSARALAAKVAKDIEKLGALNNSRGPAEERFFVSADPERFRKSALKLLGLRIRKIKKIRL